MNKMINIIQDLFGAEIYVRKHEQELRDKYGNRYLAITPKGEIIDNDKEYHELSERLSWRDDDTVLRVGTIDSILTLKTSPMCWS